MSSICRWDRGAACCSVRRSRILTKISNAVIIITASHNWYGRHHHHHNHVIITTIMVIIIALSSTCGLLFNWLYRSSHENFNRVVDLQSALSPSVCVFYRHPQSLVLLIWTRQVSILLGGLNTTLASLACSEYSLKINRFTSFPHTKS